MDNTTFLAGVRRIAASRPTYRTGGTGADGTCDCIGLIIGAMGKKYDLKSTNYFARRQMHTLDTLQDESQLHEGSIVYKSRRDTSQLNARYQAGGRYYNGDLLDYYHVGVVTGIDPLEITHCTSTGSVNGITYDDSIRAWSHFGDLLDVEFAEEENMSMEAYTAVVTAQSGSTVRMRRRPEAGAAVLAKVPVGQTVEVTESADGWAKIRWYGQTGYMMQEYLQPVESGTEDDTGEALVTISLPRGVAQTVLEAFLKGVERDGDGTGV